MNCLQHLGLWTRARGFATAVGAGPRVPQTVIEKVVQKYAVGLPPGKAVKAGDYVMIRPEHVMTHDNTGPVISKFVLVSFYLCTSSKYVYQGSSRSARPESRILSNQYSPSITTYRTGLQRTYRNTLRLKNSRGSTKLISILQDAALDTRFWSRKVTRFRTPSPLQATATATCMAA